VVLQTRDVEHPIIGQVIGNRYEEMVRAQLDERRMFRFPPYHRLIYVYLKHRDEKVLDNAALVMAGRLRASFGSRVLGPDKPPVARIQTLFIKKIVLKIEVNASMERARELLLSVQREMLQEPAYKSLLVYYDVDPM
jgi:primosomal protein N' (replication factor Y)